MDKYQQKNLARFNETIVEDFKAAIACLFLLVVISVLIIAIKNI